MNTSQKKRNWRVVNKSLIDRGDLSVWVDQEVLDTWQNPIQTGRQGAPLKYTDQAITMCIVLRYIFSLPYRQTEGFINSLFKLMSVSLAVPSYSYLCKKASNLGLELPNLEEIQSARTIAVDATGFKVVGKGQWNHSKHGSSGRKKWVKMHISVDTESQEIVSAVVTESNVHDSQVFDQLIPPKGCDLVYADKAYDSIELHRQANEKGASAIIPPKTNALLSKLDDSDQSNNPRDELILLRDFHGEDDWKTLLKYGRRSFSEGAFSRLKRIFGEKTLCKLHVKIVKELITKAAILTREWVFGT
jgi:hypothetical protein